MNGTFPVDLGTVGRLRKGAFVDTAAKGAPGPYEERGKKYF